MTAPPEFISHCPIDNITESPTNPRRRFSQQAMQDLTDSVRRHGVLVPLLVRPVNGQYEIIAGARRYRAAKLADLRELPVQVKQIGDSEAAELQILENLIREDVHPLEEALGYQALLKRPGYDIPGIAAKVAKSESYIYQRLKLIDLVKPAQEAFLNDQITAGHAILIARLQPIDQQKAFEACFQDQYGYSFQRPGSDRQARSVRDLSRWIQEHIHLDLHAAPFKKDDADLVPAAGPCTTCPKRTGFLPALFPDIAKKDTCTDGTCYAAKLQAHIDRKKSQFEAKTGKVLEISSDWSRNRKPKPGDPLTRSQYHLIENKQDRCGSAQKAIVVEGYNDRGRVLDVCADPECKRHGHSGSDERGKQQQKRQEEQRKRRQTVRTRIMEQAIAGVSLPLSRAEMELVCMEFYESLWSEYQKSILSRHGWTAEKNRGGYGVNTKGVVRKQIPQLADQELARFMMEITLIVHIDVLPYGRKDPLMELARLKGVDVKAIERKVTAELAAAKKTKKAKAETKSASAETKSAKSGTKSASTKTKQSGKKPKRPKGEPFCEECGCTESRAWGCAWDPVYLAEGRHVCTRCSDAGEEFGSVV